MKGASRGPFQPAPRGDLRRAFQARLAAHREWLQRYIDAQLRTARSSLDINEDDLFQIAWLAVLSRVQVHLEENDALPDWWCSRAKFRSYLKGIVRFSLDHVRRDNWNRRRIDSRSKPQGALENLLERTDPCPSPDERLEQQQEQDSLWELMNRLAETDRAILSLHAHGFTYERIAALLHMSASAVAKRHGRAVERLRQWKPAEETS
ncbi:MAG: sigma-70 family RNA polymerase sigma factor [Planctomycetota bacterium]